MEQRKVFAETVRQTTVTSMGKNVAPGMNITAEGPDATLYVFHVAGITSAVCKTMLTDGFTAKMRELGFAKLVCTDDGTNTFSFDLGK